MGTVTNQRQMLGSWLKVSPLADVAHCILRYDGLILITYCGCNFPVQAAIKPVMGARHCVECESLHRQHEQKRKAARTRLKQG